MKHLRVETEREEEALMWILTHASQSAHIGRDRRQTAATLLARLQAAPVARHGGIVHVEDANYLPTPGGRQ